MKEIIPSPTYTTEVFDPTTGHCLVANVFEDIEASYVAVKDPVRERMSHGYIKGKSLSDRSTKGAREFFAEIRKIASRS